jgi:pyruvate dehydrogenase (quinone)
MVALQRGSIGSHLTDKLGNRTELAMPPSFTLEVAKGVTLYAMRPAIGGRGGEVTGLARPDPWR